VPQNADENIAVLTIIFLRFISFILEKFNISSD